MIVEIIDIDKLTIRHAVFGPDSALKSQYEVYAIRKWYKRMQYLVEDENQLYWWDTDLFRVVEDSIPENGVSVQYKRFHRFRNKNYDFRIAINFYQGPKEFLENENFFFDIIENRKDAYAFLCKVMQEQIKTL